MTMLQDHAAIWQALRNEVESAAESLLRPALLRLLAYDDLPRALAHHLAHKLADENINAVALTAVFAAPCAAIEPAALADLAAYGTRDPACQGYVQPFFFFKGFAALQTHRIAHILWQQGRKLLAWHLQSRASELWQVDIHPAAQLGMGIFIDHATGLVIGETCVIGDDVTILQGVTLGGNGKSRGDRHPKIGHGVLLSVGAKVLGNICIGDGARIAAGAVVLHDVPPNVTVAGVPARQVAQASPADPALCLEHNFEFDGGLG